MKLNKKEIIKSFLPYSVVIIAAAIFVCFSVFGQTKEVATYEQVWNAVEDKGYVPIDRTEHYIEVWGDSLPGLEKALMFRDGDTWFYFFVLPTEKKAQALQTSYWYNLKNNTARYGTSDENVEYKLNGANFIINSVKANNYYTVCTRVGNTFLYAECDTDTEKPVCEIIKEIGYD